MSDILTLSVGETGHNARLDKFLSDHCPDLSRTRLKNLIVEGSVRMGEQVITTPSLKLQNGQEVTVTVPPAVEYDLTPEDIRLDIVYEDDDLLVINKSADMVVHPGAGNWSGTLVHALLAHCGDSLSGIGGVMRPGIVHRLDKGTSGLMMAAKNDHAHKHLSAQLSQRTLKRTYHALVLGTLMPPKGSVDQPLMRSPHDRLRMAVHRDGKDACTHYRTLQTFFDTFSMMECRLESGRTHQIRVHMNWLGYPLIHDPLYGPQATKLAAQIRKAGLPEDIFAALKRQALHAAEIEFVHPSTSETLHFTAPLPTDMDAIIRELTQENK